MTRRGLGKALASVGAAVVLGAAPVCGVGCAGTGRGNGEERARVDRGPAPVYESVAAAYNRRVAPLGRLWASAVVQLSYLGEDGERHREQGEGTLQVIRPDRLALSVRKLGETLFWLGCDPERYWWMELVEDRIATVGRHEDAGAGGGIGAAVRPLDIIRLLGITPLDERSGATQWSWDGALLGVTTRTGAGEGAGYQRVWVDPASYEARKVELFDAAKRVVLIADLDRYAHVLLHGSGMVSPRVAGRVLVYEPGTETEIRLSLSGVEDGAERMSPQAFDFEALVSQLGVESIAEVRRMNEVGVGGAGGAR